MLPPNFSKQDDEDYKAILLDKACTEDCKKAIIIFFKHHKVWADKWIMLTEATKVGATMDFIFDEVNAPKDGYPNTPTDFQYYLTREVGEDYSEWFEETFLLHPLTPKDFEINWTRNMLDEDQKAKRIEQLEWQLSDALVALCHKRKREEQVETQEDVADDDGISCKYIINYHNLYL
ncbi:hypothetical protein SAMD00019534_097930 [Acytostelium subglobosum LB1]|uniref:hypothetical protein n=1 Tax=Acytostelium subglobosum LB1 TaxID=1410327 RepID=UPI000644CBF8|nr:hypothetical protein SAMD00019534_097930 [Acytostelium subglobosum LB1]GAM26618.1 hypothetical protein SAMD00019534_097930 [Acytostelium subglobosum LB1]|eukprot:XP_012750279.1 hypothetical protein SAMD00019534_097930 [Acytostelium subglobosum LB1]